MKSLNLGLAVLVVCFIYKAYANPTLTPGVWTVVGSSATFNLSGTYGVTSIEVDPGHPSTLYASADQRGIWKTTDGGSNWTRMGNPPASCDYKDTAYYLDSPVRIKADPNDPLHLYATQGVRGCTQGFWISHNGGNTWVRPKSYRDALVTCDGVSDNTHMDVDPTDFNHFLIAFHYYWNGTGASGIFESKDAGASWIIHYPPSGMCCNSKGVSFLYNPALGIGNANTWMVSNDNTDFWRTDDGGPNLAKTSSIAPPHGGLSSVYYAKTGVIYVGGGSSPSRSTDNGKTWQSITGVPAGWYFSVWGDGNLIYAHNATTGDLGTQVPWYVSLETDGTHWAPYKVGAQAQTMSTGPSYMAFDKVNRIMYSANWTGGLYALNVDTGTTFVQGNQAGFKSGSRMIQSRICTTTGNHLALRGTAVGNDAGFDIFNVKGSLISHAAIPGNGSARMSRKEMSTQAVIVRAR
jgi:hypothetical protein